jgi:hypothetical protein
VTDKGGCAKGKGDYSPHASSVARQQQRATQRLAQVGQFAAGQRDAATRSGDRLERPGRGERSSKGAARADGGGDGRGQ